MIPLPGPMLLGWALSVSPRGTVPDPPPETCIVVSAEVRRQSYGYDHFVILRNGCEVERECWVSTDVSPAAVYLLVGAANEVRLLTTRGAPRRSFSVTARCEAPPPRSERAPGLSI